ncbi:sigma E regulatory protein, MucB/RseB [Candidatus Nitromaritima sp. SCGC AAA799-A02]|nr:sigma E regulatory protein, MucB/RseB [Candidatus Nitromaritima sp. SCGC AAA799-C22]KMP12613.1 sigma E regulatory protein, MucB/RseB [Candidatus Nitromaritima sp. SCGC AAA799-A02]
MKNCFSKWKRALLIGFFPILFGVVSIVQAARIDPQKLLEAVDDNLWSNTKFIEGRLIIDNGRLERVLEMNSWMEGVERSYSFYKAPPREKGTRMLKIGSKLWMYTPRTDRKILIAGHMLRQSMMGSDLSYEDMMEDKKLSRTYTARLEGMEEYQGVLCGVLHLTAHDKTTTYQTRKLWVDPERKVVLREELYAKSGMMLKDIEFLEYRTIGRRLFPRKMVFRDLLKKNTKTTYMFDVIRFDVDIPAKYFSQSILKR